MKEELMGWVQMRDNPNFAEESDWYPDDALIERLDSIVDELLTGEGPNDLIVLQDEEYLANMRQVQQHWTELKLLLVDVRNGGDPQALFDSSQEYFELVNTTVFSAEAYSEAQVNRINRILIGVNIVFVLVMAAGGTLYIRGRAVKQRADALGKIAYVDPLTQINNRASCEEYIEQLRLRPPKQDIAVIMFDMNNLKLTNDALGHQGGDRIIADFAQILLDSTGDSGFVGRFGGDEFLAVFKDQDDSFVHAFLRTVSEEVIGYNIMKPNKLERIDYSAGYVVDNVRDTAIHDIVNNADQAMYLNKRYKKKLDQITGQAEGSRSVEVDVDDAVVGELVM